LGFGKEFAALANVNGSLYFVSGQDPNFDPCFFNIFNGLTNIFLELVFNRRAAR
jgi:hypothetical protein